MGHLIEDGFIGSIDDPVANYIEEWRNGDKTNITIKHLLHMSGGLKESLITLHSQIESKELMEQTL